MNRDRSSLTIDQPTLERVCRTHRIRRLSLFGSQLKGTANPDSDVDLLVEFDPGAHPTLLDLAQIEIELSQALGGKKVDVRTPEDLSRFFRDDVLNMAEVQYVAE
ncbi:nucleotidyltransferase [Thiorhodococcus minor]|uniref:Nucleotidyltransferase n=2 Tax=Thiorhodococcus minor TaxID=57489 RepID=A0A6M0K3U5_9GAMM|nr:nucleotidyltransferase [Thiorhodococcus minor]